MTVVTLEEAKARIEELAQLATSGEEVRITQGEMPVLELKAVKASDQPAKKREGGQWAGRFVVGPEFFEPLPHDELDVWEGNSPRAKSLEAIGQAWARDQGKAEENEG